MRRLFRYGRSDADFEKFMKELETKGINAYTVAYEVKSPYINKSYTLLEVTPERRANFESWMTFVLFEILAIGSIQSDVIKPSVVNFGKGKEGEHHRELEAIDKALLQALYSDQVHYGQPLTEAIPIMATFIHQRLNKAF